jgi:ribonuclease E
MKKEMLINVLQPEECRIAIVEDGILEELYVERTSHESYVGNIYKGRIVNIEPSIQAAFVDFGVGRNGFLHVSDVEPAYYRHLEGRLGGGRRGPHGGRGRGRNHRDDEPPRRRHPDDLDAPLDDDAPHGGRGEERGRGRGRGRGRRRGGERVQKHKAEPYEETSLPPTEGAQLYEEPSLPPTESGDEPIAQEPPAESPPPNPPDDRPYYMDSSERRTDEDDPSLDPIEPVKPFSDEDLSFSSHKTSEVSETSEELRHTALEPEIPDPQPENDFHEDDLGPVETAAIADDLEPEPVGDYGEEEEPMPRRRGRGRDDRRGPRRGPFRRGSGRPGAGRPKPLIQDIFKRGQEVLVQVIKEGIGTKGPTLSTYISIAGRYLVLMPGLNRIGVSRKIIDEEHRRRLREILSELKPPRGLGFIIRTAGLDRNKKELQRDLLYLSNLWKVVVGRIKKRKSPAVIYEESDMITRTIRDTFTSEIDTVWVDEPAAFEHAQEFLQVVMPRYADRIKCYDDPVPMFHKYGIENEIARIQMRHVPLANGGSIVIDQTEALVAIDVNSGNFRADNNAEETAYQMNLLAAKEIARQLRLRDLGGVIVNDFIDMRDEKHRRSVERAMREAVKRDRARTKILKISAFGIIEMTRQRIRPSLKRSVFQDCPYCRSTGQVKTCESMSIDVMRLLQLAAHKEGIHKIQIRVHEDVAFYLQNRKRKEVAALEAAGEIQVSISGSATASPELLEMVCYDNNNNEVKFMPHEEPRPARRR